MFYSVFQFVLQSVHPIYEKGSAIAPSFGSNRHKIFQIAPTLRIDAVTKKTSQSVPPIYIKKTAQNTYIRGSLWQKNFLYILVGHFGHFNVARCWLWSENRPKKSGRSNSFKYRWPEPHRHSSGLTHQNLRRTAGGLIP